MKTLRNWMVALACAGLCSLASAQALRPEVAKPLQQAGELLKAGKSKEALAKVREADAASNKTPAEQLTIDRMRGAAAQRAGDHATVIQAFEAVYASGKLAPQWRVVAGVRVVRPHAGVAIGLQLLPHQQTAVAFDVVATTPRFVDSR